MPSTSIEMPTKGTADAQTWLASICGTRAGDTGSEKENKMATCTGHGQQDPFLRKISQKTKTIGLQGFPRKQNNGRHPTEMQRSGTC